MNLLELMERIQNDIEIQTRKSNLLPWTKIWMYPTVAFYYTAAHKQHVLELIDFYKNW